MLRSPTLQAIHMEWLSKFSVLEVIFLLGGIAVGLSVSLLLRNSSYLSYGAAFGFITSFLLSAAYFFIFYNFVRCPVCRCKLNRFKNGKRVPSKQAHTQLTSGYGCRHCGWRPDVLASRGAEGEP